MVETAELPARHQSDGAGVLDDEPDFGFAIYRHDGDHHDTEPRACGVDQEVLVPVGQLHRDALSWLRPEPVKGRREVPGRLAEPAVREPAHAVGQEGMVRVIVGPSVDVARKGGVVPVAVRAELRRIHEEIRGTEKPTRRRGKRIKRSSAG